METHMISALLMALLVHFVAVILIVYLRRKGFASAKREAVIFALRSFLAYLIIFFLGLPSTSVLITPALTMIGIGSAILILAASYLISVFLAQRKEKEKVANSFYSHTKL